MASSGALQRGQQEAGEALACSSHPRSKQPGQRPPLQLNVHFLMAVGLGKFKKNFFFYGSHIKFTL